MSTNDEKKRELLGSTTRFAVVRVIGTATDVMTIVELCSKKLSAATLPTLPVATVSCTLESEICTSLTMPSKSAVTATYDLVTDKDSGDVAGIPETRVSA
jgi:hypothetical protein